AAEARRVKSCRVMETPAARSLHGSRSQTKLNSPYSPNTPSGYSSEPQSRRGRGVVATNARKHETLFDQISCFRGSDVGLARRMKRLRPPLQSRWHLPYGVRGTSCRLGPDCIQYGRYRPIHPVSCALEGRTMRV